MNARRQERTSNGLLIAAILLVGLLLVLLWTCGHQQNAAKTAVSKIDPAVLDQLQIPAVKPTDVVIQHRGYILSYSEDDEQASWVAYVLTADETRSANYERTNRFLTDPFVRTGSASHADYEGSGYDRGHLAPAEDMAWSAETMKESFYYSNMSPQVPAFNRGVWRRLEELVRYWSTVYDSIFIVTGPVLSGHLPAIGPHRVSVPQFYYKVILDYRSGGPKGIGFVLKNEASPASLKSFAVSIDSVEQLTGIDFFPRLPDDQESRLEANPETDQWRWSRK